MGYSWIIRDLRRDVTAKVADAIESTIIPRNREDPQYIGIPISHAEDVLRHDAIKSEAYD